MPFNGRDIVKATTKQRLLEKIADKETRNWELISEITQHQYSAYYWCVMRLKTFKVAMADGKK